MTDVLQPFRTGIESLLLIAISVLTLQSVNAQSVGSDSLAVRFAGMRGQVEVGGPFAGVEFHNSWPVPARLSFYYPVANSIDLSTDYWKRESSHPLEIIIRADGRADTLGSRPWAYEWTPYRVVFRDTTADYSAALSYQFADDLPIVAMRLAIHNRRDTAISLDIATVLTPTLRTSHTYATHAPTRARYLDKGATFLATFDQVDTDSVALFVANSGASPTRQPTDGTERAAFNYGAQLAPGDSLVVVQLIGTSTQRESAEVRDSAVETWSGRVHTYENGIRAYVRDTAIRGLADPELAQTDRLARALLKANRHVLDGHLVPMPSPAQYNFFFTHDLLLTDLGAVMFDTERVRSDLLYVQSLVGADSVLVHAKYWKDSTYVKEAANSDNWNHLWFNILAASYLKHSGDAETVARLYPTLTKSMAMMLANERDGLMYAERPDWWDIGHVYGPRAYLTALTIRALDAYAYVGLILDRDAEKRATLSASAARLRHGLVDELWDEDTGYLLNGLDSTTVDRHFYSGSLLAAWFDLLEPSMRDRLLDTARRELLDENVGIRNAMPADYHLLTDVYHFQEGEVGAPFLYMNGGVWPQGNAWYALGLVAAGRADEAKDVLERTLSVAGVVDSPNGQPAFYEYRNADPGSPKYGAVDKPTFLWAGGWYLHVLYQLAGVRETPWNVSFSPNLPSSGFDDASYDLAIDGAMSRVSWSGSGPAFRSIKIDGVESASAVLTGSSSTIELERGYVRTPYVSGASHIVRSARRVGDGLEVEVRGVSGVETWVEVTGPAALSVANIAGDGQATVRIDAGAIETGVFVTRFTWALEAANATLRLGS